MHRRVGREATILDPATGAESRVPVAEVEPLKDIALRWPNYSEPLERFAFWTYLGNTVFVTVVATLLTVGLNAMAAFALSKYRFRGRQGIFLLILSILMISLSVVMVPSFMVIVGLGLSDNLWGVILSTAATPMGVFLLRQYMLTIPDDLIEAARVDAASEARPSWPSARPRSTSWSASTCAPSWASRSAASSWAAPWSSAPPAGAAPCKARPGTERGGPGIRRRGARR